MVKLSVNIKNNVPKIKNTVKKKVEHIKKKTAHSIIFNKNLIDKFFDNYILNEMITDKIHNDLGASFTYIQRKGKKILKKAKPQGEEKLSNEIKWFLNFRNSELSKLLPKIHNYSLKPGNVYMEMKYYNYPNLRKILMNDMNNDFFIRMRWNYLFEMIFEFMYIRSNSIETPKDFVEKTHYKKLRRRIKETISMAPYLANLLKKDHLIINGKRYYNISTVMSYIFNDKQVIKKLTPPRIYISHGDLHTNNILCGISHKKLILLDCRGESPYGNMYFDIAYDIGKLYHDLRGMYSFIENHKYSIYLHESKSDIEIEYEYHDIQKMEKFKKWKRYVDKLIKKHSDDKKLKYRADFTEAMLFLTMVPFHLKTKSEGLMCYITGIIRLNEWLKKYHKTIYKKIEEVENL